VLPNSLRFRGVHFAYLFGPPRFVPREEASRVHGKVCDALGYDDLTFRYGTGEQQAGKQSRGFQIEFQRPEGRGTFEVNIDNPDVSQPIRLVMGWVWPPSLEHAKQALDLTAETVLESLQGEWTLVVAEARLRAQCEARSESAIGYIATELLAVGPTWLEQLGKPLTHASLKLEVGSSGTNDSLANPKRDLTIEVLRDDPKGLYLELVSQWSQFPPVASIDLSNIRKIDKKPSEYVEDSIKYLRGRINGLAQLDGAQDAS